MICFFSEQDGGRQEDDEQFYMILWTMLLCGSLVNLVLLRVFLEAVRQCCESCLVTKTQAVV